MTQIIILEGRDGVGKSSAAKELAAQLRLKGKSVIEAREPGFTKFGEIIRSEFLLSHVTLTKESLFYLFQCARHEMLQEFINSHKDKDFIVLDRFWPSTYAYQVRGTGIPESLYQESQKSINAYVDQVGTCKLFFLSVSDEIRQDRLKLAGKGADRYESKPPEFMKAVEDAYKEFEASGIYDVIDSSQTVAAVASTIVGKLGL